MPHAKGHARHAQRDEQEDRRRPRRAGECLYGLVIGDREKLQGFANLHFVPEGSQFMGKHIAARILESLSQ
jgi:hypothetical protein